MANRTTYHDHGLIFAKEWEDLQRGSYALGDPLQMANIGKREFARLMKAAGSASSNSTGCAIHARRSYSRRNVPPKVVQERLGHKTIAITMDVYTHVLPSMQQEAAAKLGAMLHG